MTDKKVNMTGDQGPGDTCAQRHKWQMVLAKRMAKIASFIAISLAVMIGGLWLYIQQAGGLKQAIESQLSRAELGLVTSIDRAELGIFRSGLSADISLHDVTFSLAEQQLQVPRIQLSTSWQLVMSGIFWQVEFERLSLELVQEQESVSLAGEWGQVINQVTKDQGASSSDAALAWVAGRTFVIKDSQVTLQKKADDAVFSLRDVALTFSFGSDHAVNATGSAAISNSDQGQIKFEGLTNISSGFSELLLQTTNLPLSQLSAFLPASLSSLSGLGTVDSEMTMSLDGSQIETATGTMIARRGAIAGTTPFSEFSAAIGYSRTDDFLVLSDVQLLFPDGRIVEFDGRVTQLVSETPAFTGTLSLQDVPIEDLLSQWPKTALPDVRAYMIESFSKGAFKTISVPFTGQVNRINQSVSLSEFALFGSVDNVRVQTSFGHFSQIVGTANAELALEVRSGGLLKDARVSLALSDGFVTTKDADRALQFDQITGEIAYQPGRLYVPDMTVSLKQDGAFQTSVDVSVTDNRTLSSTAFHLVSDSLSLAAFQQLFPPALAQKPADYIKSTLAGGRLQDLRVHVETTAEDNKQVIDTLKATANLTDTSYQWISGLPAITDVSAFISLDENQLEVSIDQGQSEGVHLRSAKVRLAPLVTEADSRDLRISFDATSRLPDLHPILSAPQINLAQKAPFDLKNASGDIRAAATFSGKLTADNQISFALDQLDGVITKAYLPAMIGAQGLHDVDLVLSYDQQLVTATGVASFRDIVSDFTLTQDDKQREITAIIAPQEAVSSFVNDSFSQQITGPIGGRLLITSSLAESDSGGDLSAVVSADLTGAGVYIPLLDWGKLQNEPASASARLILADNQLQRIDNLVISASDLGATGSVEMTETGEFAAANLFDVRWPGNALDAILVERNRQDGLTIIAQGPRIDLRKLRKGDEAPSGIALSFDVTSEQLIIEDKVSLFGQMTGVVNEDGNGSATLQWTLAIDDDPLLEEGTIEAVFGVGGEYLSAVGLIGGAEARLEFSPDEQGNAILIITSQNAGRVLSGLGVTDTIRSGRLVLVNEFQQGRFDHYDTTINLEEFNVIEAPAAVRAFSVLGLAGLYSLVEGDGTRFTSGEARIETKAGRHKITKMVASGGAVGITLVGEYDSTTRQVDVSGNLVPVNQFSKIIGSVPLLGELLSGVDNAGIFATQFNITGTIDEPQTSVNAASLVPGIIRDIFSPDWLGRETDRIIGGDNATRESR